MDRSIVVDKVIMDVSKIEVLDKFRIGILDK